MLLRFGICPKTKQETFSSENYLGAWGTVQWTVIVHFLLRKFLVRTSHIKTEYVFDDVPQDTIDFLASASWIFNSMTMLSKHREGEREKYYVFIYHEREGEGDKERIDFIIIYSNIFGTLDDGILSVHVLRDHHLQREIVSF